MDIGARPSRVYIDGNIVFNKTLPIVPADPVPTAKFLPSGQTSCKSPIARGYVIQGVTVHSGIPNSAGIQNATIIVNASGIITCLKEYPNCGTVHFSFNLLFANFVAELS